MPSYVYKALTSDGKIIKGKTELKTREEVFAFIKEKNQIPVKITKAFTYPARKIGAKKLSIRARQLEFIYSSGTSIIGISKIFKDFTFERELLKGAPLSAALGASYPAFFLDMVKVGEKSGALPDIFAKLASYYENQDKREKQIQIALIYPAITLIFVSLAFSIVCLFWAPAYKSVYDAMRIAPPPFLLFLINFFDNVFTYALSAGGLLGVTILLIYFLKDRVELTIPIFKKEFNRRFAFALSILYESGVQIQESLRLAKRLTNNKFIKKEFDTIDRQIATGECLSSTFANIKIFDPLLIELIKSGEKSGFLAGALASCAAYLETETETLNAAVAKLAEPAMTLFLGAIIFVVMAAIMAPAILLGSQIF